MQSYVNEGETIVVLATAAAVTKDVPVVLNDIVVVPKNSAAIGDDYVAQACGVVSLPKATDAIGQGAKVYWDNTNKNVTTMSSGNTLMGRAWTAQAFGDATVLVKLTPTV